MKQSKFDLSKVKLAWEKLKVKIILNKKAVLAIALSMMAIVAISVGMYQNTKSGSGIEELVFDYISSQVGEGGLALITPDQIEQIAETVTITLEERVAGGEELTGDNIGDIKLLIRDELLRNNTYLTSADVDALLTDFDNFLKNDYMAHIDALKKRQNILEDELAGTNSSLQSKADQSDIWGLKDTDDGLKQEDKELSNRIDELGDQLNSFDGNADKITDEFGNLIDTTDKKFAEFTNHFNTLLDTRITELTTNLNSLMAEIEEKIQRNTDDIAKHDMSLEKVAEQIRECFQYVSSGKALLASTLTDKGVDTEADAKFEVINNSIMELYTKAFAAGVDSVSGVNADVLYEYHYHVDGNGDATNDTDSSKQYTTPGGCYTKPLYHQHQASCFGRCRVQGEYLRHEKNGKYHQWFYRCPVHGEYMHQALHEDDGVGSTCTANVQYCGGEDQIIGYVCGCGMVEEQILSATIMFDRLKANDSTDEAIKKIEAIPENDYKNNTEESRGGEGETALEREEETDSESGSEMESESEMEPETEIESESSESVGPSEETEAEIEKTEESTVEEIEKELAERETL